MELRIVYNKIYKFENSNFEYSTVINSSDLENLIKDAENQVLFLNRFIEENKLILEEVLKLESELKP